MNTIFNHNDLGRPNGNYFALPYRQGEGDIEIISVPWDATTSYNPGTAKAPQAIINASLQVDLFDSDVDNAWEIKISNTTPDITQLNERSRGIAREIISYLEQGGASDDREISPLLNQVNEASETVNSMVYTTAKNILDKAKIAAVVGGEHSVPLGLIRAVAEKFPGTGILHIDAHADLRKAYEGFTYSHASIMYNVINEIKGISKLVQVAIRDFCEEEKNLADKNNRIVVFSDSYLKEKQYNGEPWKNQCAEIISHLPQQVYVSFDIDGLNPYLCPNTGTPVPGGLEFAQTMYLLKQLAFSGRRIVGFDLNEVSPGSSGEWDANVGARALFKLCCYTHYSNNFNR
ncbi:MAG: agmatinase family protein [Prevotellaceae bacterium]|jgi:agmatinase|nr:agmatinase family protein [Prevotellaceae bacterium]